MNYFKFKQDAFIKVKDDGRKVLGVDINPEKSCMFNCIVCNRGNTVFKGTYHDFGPVEDSLKCLGEKMDEEKPELVEIYGSGEVLTNAHLGDVIVFVHSRNLPIRLVTNGMLLGIGEHMRLACMCEEVVAAFGIVDEEIFKKYHRPSEDSGFSAARQYESVVNFSRHYKGKFMPRIFLSKGMNDSDESVAKIRDLLDQIQYDSLWVASTNKLAVEEKRAAEIETILSRKSYKS